MKQWLEIMIAFKKKMYVLFMTSQIALLWIYHEKSIIASKFAQIFCAGKKVQKRQKK